MTPPDYQTQGGSTMEQMYPSSNKSYETQRLNIDRCEKIDRKMDRIDYDCKYSVDPLGGTLIRIFFHPKDKTFSQEDVRKLMKVLRDSLGFKNTAPPKETSSYAEHYHRWTRDFRESEGTFHMSRYVKSFWTEPKCDLLLLIEEAPMLNCKLVKKTKEVEYYEADCSEVG